MCPQRAFGQLAVGQGGVEQGAHVGAVGPGPRLDHTVERLRQEVINRNDIDRIRRSMRAGGVDIDTRTLQEIKEYNFNSRGLQFSPENYNAWTRLGNGNATIGDVRYLVHEASEVKALKAFERQTGFDFMGRRWDGMSDQTNFNGAYTTAHSHQSELLQRVKFLRVDSWR
ncbi:hypothetical protein [Nocardia neocaledoniensis]|uniref:hypothetical protein n=1 Tax=Nocardia neocaledoniensis TaxID=236511 RepID=UPI0011B6AAC3|nr:hypothetical protein [Nocardia neocaledoniensis]